MTTLAPLDLGAHVEHVAFLGEEAAFALASGMLAYPPGREERVVDGLVCAASRTGAMVVGGEDGRVVRLSIDGSHDTVLERDDWIDAVALGPGGAVAASCGRRAWIVAGTTVSEHETARAIEGLAFAPKGTRLACARYGGVSLFYAGNPKAVSLDWEGAHTGVTVSGDGRYVVSTMQENALHGWRIDGKGEPHMRMSGYPAKVKSISWGPRNRYLATSGASSAVVWDFSGKGPQGTAPKQLGDRADQAVTQVASHPTEAVVAIGYRDGMVLAARVEDAAETLLRRPSGSPVTAMAWDERGTRLAFGCANGEAGTITLSG